MKIIGFKDTVKNIEKLAVGVDEAVDMAVRKTAITIMNDSVASIKETSHGRSYKKTANVTHIASKEGDAPNSDEGRLIGSIDMSHSKGQKIAWVGTGVDYGAILELAKNRPWLMPSVKRNIVKFDKFVISSMKQIIKKAHRARSS